MPAKDCAGQTCDTTLAAGTAHSPAIVNQVLFQAAAWWRSFDSHKVVTAATFIYAAATSWSDALDTLTGDRGNALNSKTDKVAGHIGVSCTSPIKKFSLDSVVQQSRRSRRLARKLLDSQSSANAAVYNYGIINDSTIKTNAEASATDAGDTQAQSQATSTANVINQGIVANNGKVSAIGGMLDWMVNSAGG